MELKVVDTAVVVNCDAMIVSAEVFVIVVNLNEVTDIIGVNEVVGTVVVLNAVTVTWLVAVAVAVTVAGMVKVKVVVVTVTS